MWVEDKTTAELNTICYNYPHVNVSEKQETGSLTWK